MRYLLLLYGEPVRPEDVDPAVFQAHADFCRALIEAGALVDSAPLVPPEQARTVRIKRRERIVVDGPFAETKEVLGGFYLFEADGLDSALEVAARVPAARMGGAVEVRPLVER